MNDNRSWETPLPSDPDGVEAVWWRGWRGALVVGGGALLLVLLVGLALGEIDLEDGEQTDVVEPVE